MNTDRITNPQSNSGPHLSEETLSELASGRLNDADRAAAMRHAETCAECSEALRDYLAMTSALKNLPAPRPRRTFQLTEVPARAKSRWWALPPLLPTLPALRIATIAVAVLLLAVAGADRLTEPGGNSSNNEHFAAMIAPSATEPASVPTTANANVHAKVAAPTDQTTASGSGQIDAGAASESESESATDQTTAAYEAPTDEAAAEVGAAPPAAAAPNSAGDTGAGFSQAAVAKVAASPELIATPAPTATATATASPTATATASPTPAAPAASTSSNGSSRTSWRIAELGLALLLLWLIVTYVGVRRTSRDQDA